MEEEMRFLTRRLAEQQKEVRILHNITGLLLRAHVELRQLHAELCDQHLALCGCLGKRGLLSQPELVASRQLQQQVGIFEGLLCLPSVASRIEASLSAVALNRLHTTSERCMARLFTALADVQPPGTTIGASYASCPAVPRGFERWAEGALFQDLRRGSTLADMLTGAMGVTTAQRLQATFRSAWECQHRVPPSGCQLHADCSEDEEMDSSEVHGEHEQAPAMAIPPDAEVDSSEVHGEPEQAPAMAISSDAEMDSLEVHGEHEQDPAMAISPRVEEFYFQLEDSQPHVDCQGGADLSPPEVHCESDEQAPAAQRWLPGQHAQLVGLKRRPDLNRVKCTLVKYEPATDRWHALLPNRKRLQVKPSNIEPVIPAGAAPWSWEPVQPSLFQSFMQGSGRLLLRMATFLGTPATASLEVTARPVLTAFAGLGRIYICGGLGYMEGLGYHLEAPRNAVCFDLRTHVWRPLPDTASPRLDATCATLARRLYLVGGREKGQALRSAECFDPAAGVWRPTPPMSVGRSSASAAVLDSQLYVCGGQMEAGAGLCSAECFSPVRQSWQSLPPMCQGRWAGFAFAVGKRLLYLCGGYHEGALSYAECFSPARAAWEPTPQLSERRYATGTASLGRHLYACGGFSDGLLGFGAENCLALGEVNRRALASAERMDLTSGRWEALSPMSQPRAGASVLAVSTARLVVCGGMSREAGRGLETVESFDARRGVWERAPAMLNPRAYATAAVAAGRLYICGGCQGTQQLNEAECLDLATGVWRSLPTMTDWRSRAYGGLLPLKL